MSRPRVVLDTNVLSRHDSDNRFYECADAARADCIITGNLKHFPKPHKHTKVITGRQLLELFTVEPPEQ